MMQRRQGDEKNAEKRRPGMQLTVKWLITVRMQTKDGRGGR
jgi:hypothetical protein